MAIKLNILRNATLLVDGVAHPGKAKEVTPPNINQEMAEFGGLGVYGKSSVAVGLEQMDGGKIVWEGWYPEIFTQLGKINQPVNIQIRGNILEKNAGTSTETAQTIFMRIIPTSHTNGGYKRGENVEWTTEFITEMIKVEFGGQEYLHIDVLANIFDVDQVDELAQFKANQGI